MTSHTISSDQNHILSLIKSKGVGASMSKHLDSESIQSLHSLFQSSNVHIASKATLLTAILILPANEAESRWISDAKANYTQRFPEELHTIFDPKASAFTLDSINQKILRSEALNETETRDAILEILSPECPDEKKAVFLEGLRLKRESCLENQAVYQTLYQGSHRLTLSIDTLVEIADPFDGFKRHLNISPFIACLMAAMGVPTLLQGIDEGGPKYGLSTAQVLNAAGKQSRQRLEASANSLERIGVAFVHQADAFPELYQLWPLRAAILKRPVLSTFEKCLSPLEAKNGNHIILSFTHPPYKQMLSDVFKGMPGPKSQRILRGLEGSSVLPMDRRAPYLFQEARQSESGYIRPADLEITEGASGIECNEEGSRQDQIQNSISWGLSALSGHASKAAEYLAYLAATNCQGVNDLSLGELYKQAKDCIQSGAAKEIWEQWT